MTVSSLPRAAAWYAHRGWTIFPLRPHTKEPFAGIGVYSATSDPEQVGAWWQRWPDANIGLHCGGCGVLGLDMDMYKDSFAGDELLTRQDEETITNLTGGGGVHLLYALAKGEKYSNQRGNLPPGIDIKSWGGYLVLPPSIHPSGTPYQWETGYGPHEMELLPLPAKLRTYLEEAKVHQRPIGLPDVEAVAIAAKRVRSILKTRGIVTYGEQAYDKVGRKWIMKVCPFAPESDPHPADKAAYIVISRDGYIAAGCHHERCREAIKQAGVAGWNIIRGLRHEHA